MVHDYCHGIGVFTNYLMQIIILDLRNGHLRQRLVSLVFRSNGIDYHFPAIIQEA